MAGEPQSLWAFALASFILELTPGPNMGYLAALALAEGRRAGLLAVAGVATGLAAIGTLAAFGLTAIIEQVPAVYAGLRYAGLAFLLWLAFDAWRDPPAGARDNRHDWQTFGRSFLTNALNPKATLFFVAALPEFLHPDKPYLLVQNLTLVAIYVLIATLVHGTIVLFADGLHGVLLSGRRERLVRRGLAIMLALVALWFFWSTRR